MLPSWESLESYISNYHGRTKVQRLLHIAEAFPAQEHTAYCLLLSILQEESLDVATYELVVAKLKPQIEVDIPQHDLWIREASKKASATGEKLEQELKAYKNNLIKESIRMGQQDIANHYIKTGDLGNALRTFVRNRDYCTTPLHVFQANMSVINTSILLGQWSQVQAYISKLEASSPHLREEHAFQINIATGLMRMQQKNYAESARIFLHVNATTGDSYNHITSRNDIAIFTCLMALATFTRDEVLGLIESSTFRAFLELETSSREAIAAFYNRRYADCFDLLESIKADMLADIYFSSHVAGVYGLIKERAYLQYIGAFSAISFKRLSKTFATSDAELEIFLIRLIEDRKLPLTRIDTKYEFIITERMSARQTTCRTGPTHSHSYNDDVNNSLNFLTISGADIQVNTNHTIKQNQLGMPSARSRAA